MKKLLLLFLIVIILFSTTSCDSVESSYPEIIYVESVGDNYYYVEVNNPQSGYYIAAGDSEPIDYAILTETPLSNQRTEYTVYNPYNFNYFYIVNEEGLLVHSFGVRAE